MHSAAPPPSVTIAHAVPVLLRRGGKKTSRTGPKRSKSCRISDSVAASPGTPPTKSLAGGAPLWLPLWLPLLWLLLPLPPPPPPPPPLPPFAPEAAIAAP